MQFYQEFEDVSAVDQHAKFAKIHALVASLSLMKTSGSGQDNYFDGQICDGKKFHSFRSCFMYKGKVEVTAAADSESVKNAARICGLTGV